MKKMSLGLATIGLFVGAVLFTFSTDANGRLDAFKKAQASGLTYQLNTFICPDGKTVIYICGPGTFTSCTNIGSCSSF